MKRALKAVLRRLARAAGLPQLVLPQLIKKTRKALREEMKRDSARQQARLESLLAGQTRQTEKVLAAGLRRIEERIGSYEARISALEGLLETDRRQYARLEELLVGDQPLRPEDAALLDLARIGDHVRRRFQSATVSTEPFAHIIVDDLLPAAFYDLLLETVPPKVFFSREKNSKQDFRLGTRLAPRRSREVWEYMGRQVCPRVLMPILLERFAPMWDAHLRRLFGEAGLDRARELPMTTFDGRIMRRRPGYRLGPHQDPARFFLTALLYLPASGSDEAPWGTQLFASEQSFSVPVSNVFYAEAEGLGCSLAKTALYRPNRLLVFLNHRSLHGAEIPPEQAPADLERIAFQFYVGPETAALKKLVRSLPSESRGVWRTRRSEKAVAAAE